MKVLFVTPYITSPRHPSLMMTQTGFGYMVHDIAEYVGKTDKVDLLTERHFIPSMSVDGINIVGCSWWSFLNSLTIRSFFDGIAFLKKYSLPFKEQLRTLHVFLSMGKLSKIAEKYDIIHIHGCSALTDASIRICKRKGVPFLVTLHGLNSFSEKIQLHPSLKKYERDFLKDAVNNHYPISFISSGNKLTAEKSTKMKADSFHVIFNGCDVTPHKSSFDVRSAYNIKIDDFVFAFVGNISQNKNQYQVARAWSLLPENVKLRCKVLFVGKYTDDDEVVRYIRNNCLQENLILCGMQQKDKVASYYQAADATILTSETEGFGLSIIEGYVYGIPNITFEDLPAAYDLYDNKTMIFANNRSDEAVAEAMEKIMHIEFDSEYIQKYAQKFSLTNMANSYLDLYNHIIQKGNDTNRNLFRG